MCVAAFAKTKTVRIFRTRHALWSAQSRVALMHVRYRAPDVFARCSRRSQSLCPALRRGPQASAQRLFPVRSRLSQTKTPAHLRAWAQPVRRGSVMALLRRFRSWFTHVLRAYHRKHCAMPVFQSLCAAPCLIECKPRRIRKKAPAKFAVPGVNCRVRRGWQTGCNLITVFLRNRNDGMTNAAQSLGFAPDAGKAPANYARSEFPERQFLPRAGVCP